MPSTHKWLAQRQKRPGISHRGGESAQSDRQEAAEDPGRTSMMGPPRGYPQTSGLTRSGLLQLQREKAEQTRHGHQGARRSWDLGIEPGAGRRKAAGGRVGAVPTCFPPRTGEQQWQVSPGQLLIRLYLPQNQKSREGSDCVFALTPPTAREFPRPTLEGGMRRGGAQAVGRFEPPG